MKKVIPLLICIALLCSPHQALANSKTVFIVEPSSHSVKVGDVVTFRVSSSSNSTTCTFYTKELSIRTSRQLTTTNLEVDRARLTFTMTAITAGNATVGVHAYGEDYCENPGGIGSWQWVYYNSGPTTVTIEGYTYLPLVMN
jgi:plastocyanin